MQDYNITYNIHILSFLYRSGRYVINTSSDGEHLLESPGQSPQQPVSSVSCHSVSLGACMLLYIYVLVTAMFEACVSFPAVIVLPIIQCYAVC